MSITTLSSREFNQDISRADKAAANGPVSITDGSRPAHVLLTIDEFQRLAHTQPTLVDLLDLPPGVEDVELELPPRGRAARPIDFD